MYLCNSQITILHINTNISKMQHFIPGSSNIRKVCLHRNSRYFGDTVEASALVLLCLNLDITFYRIERQSHRESEKQE